MDAASPPQLFELIGALERNEVEYVVIGGVAMQAHGHVRTTQDLDIIVGWREENMRRLGAALGELGARLRGVDAELLAIDLTNARQLLEGGNFLMRTDHGDLDVFAVEQTPGAPRSFEQLRERAMRLELRGLIVLVAGREDLIQMKLASSRFRDRLEVKRRQDLDDIAVLERLRDDRPRQDPPQPGRLDGPPGRRRPSRGR